MNYGMEYGLVAWFTVYQYHTTIGPNCSHFSLSFWLFLPNILPVLIFCTNGSNNQLQKYVCVWDKQHLHSPIQWTKNTGLFKKEAAADLTKLKNSLRTNVNHPCGCQPNALMLISFQGVMLIFLRCAQACPQNNNKTPAVCSTPITLQRLSGDVPARTQAGLAL